MKQKILSDWAIELIPEKKDTKPVLLILKDNTWCTNLNGQDYNWYSELPDFLSSEIHRIAIKQAADKVLFIERSLEQSQEEYWYILAKKISLHTKFDPLIRAKVIPSDKINPRGIKPLGLPANPFDPLSFLDKKKQVLNETTKIKCICKGQISVFEMRCQHCNSENRFFIIAQNFDQLKYEIYQYISQSISIEKWEHFYEDWDGKFKTMERHLNKDFEKIPDEHPNDTRLRLKEYLSNLLKQMNPILFLKWFSKQSIKLANQIQEQIELTINNLLDEKKINVPPKYRYVPKTFQASFIKMLFKSMKIELKVLRDSISDYKNVIDKYLKIQRMLNKKEPQGFWQNTLDIARGVVLPFGSIYREIRGYFRDKKDAENFESFYAELDAYCTKFTSELESSQKQRLKLGQEFREKFYSH